MRRHAARRGGPVNLAWVLMSGVNTGRRGGARAGAAASDGAPVRALRDRRERSDGPLPARARRGARRASCPRSPRNGMRFVRRYSGGPDIHAACGMLARARAAGARTRPSQPCRDGAHPAGHRPHRAGRCGRGAAAGRARGLPHRDRLRARGRRLRRARGGADLRGEGAAVVRPADRPPGRGGVARLGGGRGRRADRSTRRTLLARAAHARAATPARAARHRDRRARHRRRAGAGAPGGARADRGGRHAARRPERQPVRLREPDDRRARGRAARRRGRARAGRRTVPRRPRVHDPLRSPAIP